MADWMSRRANRREQVREQRAKVSGTWRKRVFSRLASAPTVATFLFVVGACSIVLLGEGGVGHSIGQRVEEPIYAKVDFRVPDQEQSAAAKEAARAATP